MGVTTYCTDSWSSSVEGSRVIGRRERELERARSVCVKAEERLQTYHTSLIHSEVNQRQRSDQ